MTGSASSSFKDAPIGASERSTDDQGREAITIAAQNIDDELTLRIRKMQALVKELSIDSTTSSSLVTGSPRVATSAANGLLTPRQLSLGLDRLWFQGNMCRACRRQQQQQQQKKQPQESEKSTVQHQRRGDHAQDRQHMPHVTLSEKWGAYEHELEWLMLSKVAAQTYGQALGTILELTISLGDDLWYWDDVLGWYE